MQAIIYVDLVDETTGEVLAVEGSILDIISEENGYCIVLVGDRELCLFNDEFEFVGD